MDEFTNREELVRVIEHNKVRLMDIKDKLDKDFFDNNLDSFLMYNEKALIRLKAKVNVLERILERIDAPKEIKRNTFKEFLLWNVLNYDAVNSNDFSKYKFETWKEVYIMVDLTGMEVE